MLINIVLVLLFVLIISCFTCYFKIVENMDNQSNKEFQPYDNLEQDRVNGPRFLAIKNAANISVLNSRVEKLLNLESRFSKIENRVKINHDGIQNLTNELGNFRNNRRG